MRRMLIGVLAASIAVATATPIGEQNPPTAHYAVTLEERNALELSWPEGAFQLRRLSEEEKLQLRTQLLMQDAAQISRPPIDSEISIVDCRIVAQEHVRGDAYLLTEVCAWRGGRVERRRFLALRRDDGPLRGWMYPLGESAT